MTSEFDQEGPGRADEASQDLVEIDLNFDTLRSFQAEFAPNLCREGLFIGTQEPLPPSTVVRFRILLPGDFVLAEGTAVVEWTREPGSIPALPPGMALRFVALSDSSQETIDEIVDSHIAAGGFAFELEPSIGEPGEIPTDALAGSGPMMGGARSSGDVRRTRGSPDDSYRLTVRATGVPAEEGDRTSLQREQEVATSAEKTETPAPDEVLPSWLREQADQRKLELETDPAFEPLAGTASAPNGVLPEYGEDEGMAPPATTTAERGADSGANSEVPDESHGGFDVTFVDDREIPDDTMLHPDAGPAAEVTVVSNNGGPSATRSRAWLLLPVALVVLGALAAGWWFLLGPGARPVQQAPSAAVIKDTPVPAEAEQAADTTAPPAASTAAPTAVQAAGAQQTIGHKPLESARIQNPASRVLGVEAETGKSETVIVIRGNGLFADDAYRLSKLNNPDRVLVRIRGIQSGYAPAEIEVGSPEVEKLRIGLHPEENPPTLYVVLDLAGSSVEVLGSTVRGDVLKVIVGRR